MKPARGTPFRRLFPSVSLQLLSSAWLAAVGRRFVGIAMALRNCGARPRMRTKAIPSVFSNSEAGSNPMASPCRMNPMTLAVSLTSYAIRRPRRPAHRSLPNRVGDPAWDGKVDDLERRAR
jgi:hypothetical protein